MIVFSKVFYTCINHITALAPKGQGERARVIWLTEQPLAVVTHLDTDRPDHPRTHGLRRDSKVY
jgi:hypothetical protein